MKVTVLLLLLLLLLVASVRVRGEGLLSLVRSNGNTGGGEQLPADYYRSEDRQSVCHVDETAARPSPFCYPRVVPMSSEWTTVLPGQIVRAGNGLNVRLNMETHVKEARYGGGPNDDSDSQGELVAVEASAAAAASSSNDDDRHEPPKPLTPERRRELEEWWEEMHKLSNQESVLLRSSVDVLLKEPAAVADNELVHALHSMEDIVHHVDYAADMVTMGGLRGLLQHITHPDAQIRRAVAVVLGSSLQSNPKVQSAALSDSHRVLGLLLDRLDLETDAAVLSGQLHALGCLLRGSELAVTQFLDLAGPAHIASTLARFDGDAHAAIRRKGVTLLTDIKTLSDAGKALLVVDAAAWCPTFESLLQSGHVDSIQKAAYGLDALALAPLCPSLSDSIEHAEQTVRAHAQQEEPGNNEVFDDLVQLLSRLSIK